MRSLTVHLAIREESFEKDVAALLTASGCRVMPVRVESITNSARDCETIFVVEEGYESILELVEFHNTCHFNFLPVIVVAETSSSFLVRLEQARFPYKYCVIERAILLPVLPRLIALLDDLRRAKFQEHILSLYPALIAPFSVPRSRFADALDTALRAILDMLFAEKGSIMLLNRWGNLVVEAASKKGIVGVEVPYDYASPAWSVVESGKPLFCEDIARYPRFKKKAAAYTKDYFLIVPIAIHGKTLGVLNLSDKMVSLLFDQNDLLRAQGLLRLLEPVVAARCGELAVR